MPWYMTKYPAWPDQPKAGKDELVGYYSSFVFARGMDEAKRIVKARNIGEVIEGLWGGRVGKPRLKNPHERPSDQLRRRKLTPRQRIDVIHNVCFLSYILQRSTGAPAQAILGDEGLLHQTVHCLQHGNPPRRALIDSLRHFERLVPGYWPRSVA